MKIKYDFIEIGTSDFDTLIQECDDNTIGLSIEPIKYYLDRLPNKSKVKKLQVAVSDSDGFIEIYYISDEKIKEHNLKWWVRGSNSIGHPHPFTVKEYGEEFYNSVVTIDKVPTLSWKSLVSQENIGSIGYLKIDTEGYDHIILEDYFNMCKEKPELLADKIKFERHPGVSDIARIDEILSKFRGYKVEYSGTDVILTKFKIPRIIHQTYKTNQLPEQIRESVESLKSMNPDFEYRFYDDNDCLSFIKENYDDETFNLYESINPNYSSARADFFRYLLMYKIGGVYLDIKSATSKPLSETLIESDEYLLTHWIGKDWSKELNYHLGEFQNWHIICKPGHPFLGKTIELVKNNLRNYKGEKGKKAVLDITGPIVYSKAILSLIDEYRFFKIDSPVREFKIEQEINLIYRNTLNHQNSLYGSNVKEDEPIVINSKCGLFYKGKKIADKGFILNLPHRTDRLENSINLLNELGFTGYEVYEGVMIEEPEFKKLGCTKSYLKMFKEILDSDAENVLVFEDDIKLMNGTTKKDLDRIFEDWNTIKQEYDIVALGTKLLPRTKIQVNGATHGYYEEMLCTQSFFYKREIIKHIYSELSNFLDPKDYLYKCTIDMFLNDCSSEEYRFIHSHRHKKFNFGITIPMVFSQTESYSDNEDKLQNYEKEMQGSFYNSLKQDKGFVLYGTENYLDIIRECAKSIREFSSLPIFVYLMNSEKKVDVENTKTIKWVCDVENTSDSLYVKSGDNFYIDRRNPTIYKILIQRPLVVKHALSNFLKTACYVDSDSVATPLVESIFSFYDENSTHPYFVEGVYDYLRLYGKGGGGNFGGTLEDTLEFETCKLFSVDQSVRTRYRQTGYFVSGQNTFDFLDEWYWMCVNPKVLKNCELYAPFNEETIMNVILWKYNIQVGLPYLYVNGTIPDIKKMYFDVTYKGPNINNFIGDWQRAPQDKKHLLFFHGEKNPDKMREMLTKIKEVHQNKLRVLFFAPHLSTGGMPSYLLKRIESITNHQPEVELYVVEFCLYATNYVVQRNKIKNIIPKDRFWTLNNLDNHSEENSMKLIEIIKQNSIDIVHIDEVPEGFDSFNKITKKVLNALFDNSRTWRVVETCHNIWFDPKNLSFVPDGFAFCTPYHEKVQFKDVKTLKQVFEFPIENKSKTSFERMKSQQKLGLDIDKLHILNVGLWTEGKNQGEGVEVARLLEKSNPHIQFHFVGNQASNFEKYWGPIMKNLPSNVKVWGERDDIDEFMSASDVLMFNSTWECNPIVLREAASYGLKILARNLPQYFDMFTPFITPIESSDVNEIKNQLLTLINSKFNPPLSDGSVEEFAKDHVDFYKKVKNTDVTVQNKIPSNLHIIQYYIEQPFLELRGDSDSKYTVQFFDEKGVIHYQNTLSINSWVKLNRQYFTKWRTKIFDDKTLILDRTLNYEGQRVFISFDSRSLGDSVAWIPYCLEFKKKHKCDVIVSTFWNKLFKKVYPELEFVEPGSVVNNIHGMYKLGWFWDKDKEPEVPNTIPLQKAATNILGLDYTEIKPRIDYHISQRPYENKYVTIATNSTAGCKFWTKEGWQELVNYLVSQGYKVVNVSKENNELRNVTKISDVSIENTMNVIHHSDFFIGLSSGLSWLSWGMGKKVVMISNFTTADHEFNLDCIRITNPLVCNGCWNNPEFKFDKGDWNWCPVHKGTERQFECHKSITSNMVIDKIQQLLK